MDPPTTKSLCKVHSELCLRRGVGRYFIALAKHHKGTVNATPSTQDAPAATLAVTFLLEYGERLWPADQGSRAHLIHRIDEDGNAVMVYKVQYQSNEEANTGLSVYTVHMRQQPSIHESVAATMIPDNQDAAFVSLYQDLTGPEQAQWEQAAAARRQPSRTISQNCDHDQIASSQLGRKLEEYFVALASAQKLHWMDSGPQDWLTEILSTGLRPQGRRKKNLPSQQEQQVWDRSQPTPLPPQGLGLPNGRYGVPIMVRQEIFPLKNGGLPWKTSAEFRSWMHEATGELGGPPIVKLREISGYVDFE